MTLMINYGGIKMDFVARCSFPFYIFYCICSFLGFFVYSLENGYSWVVAFFAAGILTAIFVIISAITILPIFYLIVGILIDVCSFAFRLFKS